MFRSPFVKRKIVCIGGGNAMPKAVLSGLKDKNVELTVVSAVLDSGRSSGRLRKEYSIISPGDVRRAFLALCNLPVDDKDILDCRFPAGELSEHNLWNIIFVAAYLKYGSYRSIFERINGLLVGSHKILPSTIHESDLVAILEDGQEIVGESNIDVPKHNPSLKIKEVFLRPLVKACPQTIKRIGLADLVVIGPGDIYSSLMQVLLVDGTHQAIKASKAKKVYICNAMTKDGESNGFKVGDFVRIVEQRLDCELDYVIYNSKVPSEERVDAYREKNPQFIDLVSPDGLPESKKYIGVDLLPKEGDIVHDPEKIAKILLNL